MTRSQLSVVICVNLFKIVCTSAFTAALNVFLIFREINLLHVNFLFLFLLYSGEQKMNYFTYLSDIKEVCRACSQFIGLKTGGLSLGVFVNNAHCQHSHVSCLVT